MSVGLAFEDVTSMSFGSRQHFPPHETADGTEFWCRTMLLRFRDGTCQAVGLLSRTPGGITLPGESPEVETVEAILLPARAAGDTKVDRGE